jgi:hypothetical protein
MMRCRNSLLSMTYNEINFGSSPKRVGKTRPDVRVSGPFSRGFRHFLGGGNLA